MKHEGVKIIAIPTFMIQLVIMVKNAFFISDIVIFSVALT